MNFGIGTSVAKMSTSIPSSSPRTSVPSVTKITSTVTSSTALNRSQKPDEGRIPTINVNRTREEWTELLFGLGPGPSSARPQSSKTSSTTDFVTRKKVTFTLPPFPTLPDKASIADTTEAIMPESEPSPEAEIEAMPELLHKTQTMGDKEPEKKSSTEALSSLETDPVTEHVTERETEPYTEPQPIPETEPELHGIEPKQGLEPGAETETESEAEAKQEPEDAADDEWGGRRRRHECGR